MRRGFSDREIPDKSACLPIEDGQLTVKPLGLINQVLIAISPHVVGVVHVDLWKRDLPRRLPGRGTDHRGGTRLTLAGRLFELCIYPHFAHACCGRIKWRLQRDIVPVAGIQHRWEIDHPDIHSNIDVRVSDMPGSAGAIVLPIGRMRRNKERPQQPRR